MFPNSNMRKGMGSSMCLFCDLVKNRESIIHENELACAFYDSFPVNPGHVLIVPKRHVNDFFGLSKEEKIAIDNVIMHMKNSLDNQFQPDGYNIGINNGEAAGQTIFHAHVHLIPRYRNDMEDPRGGVRGVIPRKQRYS
jgi:diadenosine tetraphosphate (Ap4A) HIT family hydrolase